MKTPARRNDGSAAETVPTMPMIMRTSSVRYKHVPGSS